MSTCAVCRLDDGLVINVIIAEPTDEPPYGCQLISINGIECGISWRWDGTKFISSIPQPPSA